MVDMTYHCKKIPLLTVDFKELNDINAVRIVTEGSLRLTGKFVLDEGFLFILQTNEGQLVKNVFNSFTINNLEKVWGSESKDWVGKVLNVVKMINPDGKPYLDFIPVDSIEGNLK